MIFDIQRFSLQDGPGIRSTVFMKGCPLRCMWCSNPESWNSYPEIMTRDLKCARCGKCAAACPRQAITVSAEAREIDRSICDNCGKCVEACPNGALRTAGRYVTVDEVIAEVESDKLFYAHSGGGVTISGGEPLFQWCFVRRVLAGCRERGLHTALDTSGLGEWSHLGALLEHVNLVLLDVKHLDGQAHREGTTKPNGPILDNARRIAEADVTIWLRFPLIPGYNDAEENVVAVARLGVAVGAEQVSLLPYHTYGVSKYRQLGRSYQLPEKPIDDGEVSKVKELLESGGMKVVVGA